MKFMQLNHGLSTIFFLTSISFLHVRIAMRNNLQSLLICNSLSVFKRARRCNPSPISVDEKIKAATCVRAARRMRIS